MTDLTLADVAADLHKSPYTVREYLSDGRIPGGYQVVDRGQWLVDADTYWQWKRSRQAAVDPHRIEPRSARSKAAQNRRRRTA